MRRAPLAVLAASAMVLAVTFGCTAQRPKFVPPTTTSSETPTTTSTRTLSPTWYPSFSPSLTFTASVTPPPPTPPPVTCFGGTCTRTATAPATMTSTRSRTFTRTLTPTPTQTLPGGGTPTPTNFVVYDEPFCPQQPYLWGLTGASGGGLIYVDDSHLQPTCTCSPVAASGVFSIAVYANGAHFTLSVPPTLTGTTTPQPTPTFAPEAWVAGYLFHCPQASSPCPPPGTPTATSTPGASPTACAVFATGPGIGRDLTGYSKLEFQARGLLGGEAVTFGYGFANDSSQAQVSTVLTQAYQTISLPVPVGSDLTHIAALFWWRSNVAAPQTFYVDRVVFGN